MTVWAIWMDRWGWIEHAYSEEDGGPANACEFKSIRGRVYLLSKTVTDDKSAAIRAANEARKRLIADGSFGRMQTSLDRLLLRRT